MRMGIGLPLKCGRSGSWSPAQLASLAAWYEAGPEYCYTDGAASFTAASSQFLSCASNSSLQTGDVDFWAAGWVYINSITAYDSYFGKLSEVASEKEWLLFGSSGVPTIGIWKSGTFALHNFSDGLGAIPLNTWTFLICYYNSTTKQMGVARNSNSPTTQTLDGTPNVNAADFLLGKTASGASYFDGRLDSVCFGKSPPGGIDGIISTISSRLYNSGDGLAYADLTTQEKTDWGLVSFWNLNEASGTRNDSHGTNHLTDNNSVGLAAGIAQAQCGDGDPIALWTDRSGNGYNLTQTDPLKRATLRLVSGKWVSLFDGINDTMECAYTHSGSFTMGMGINLLDPGNYPMAFVLYASLAELRSESTQGKYSINGATSLGAYIVNDDVSLIGVMNSTGARAVYVDGAEYGTATVAAGAVPANTIRLGTRDGTLYPANMRTGTVVLTTSVIDSNTIAKMSNYIANRLP